MCVTISYIGSRIAKQLGLPQWADAASKHVSPGSHTAKLSMLLPGVDLQCAP